MSFENNPIRICILDTETNGLPIRNDFSSVSMLELAYIIVDLDLNIIKEKNYLIKGKFEVPEIITQLTGITKQMTNEKGRPLEVVSKEFYKDLTDNKLTYTCILIYIFKTKALIYRIRA